MSSRLDRVTDWAALAKSSNYCAAKLALTCRVSTRQLERYFHIKHHAAPHQVLRSFRLRRAVELIRDRMLVKDVASELGYKNAAHFAHDFKEYFGVCPSGFGQNPSLAVSGRQNVAF
jgi:transcriptional regulator GlxA family with amidase domain